MNFAKKIRPKTKSISGPLVPCSKVPRIRDRETFGVEGGINQLVLRAEQMSNWLGG